MAIAFDAKSQLTATNSTTDGNWTHTPVGTPAAVVVMITQGGATTDQVAGVTYNGVAMTRVATASDSGEAERVYLYFLNTGLGTGAKTVAVDITGSSPYAATAVTVTADSGTADIDISNFGNGTSANPTLTLDYTDGLADWIALVCMGEGANAVTGASINTGTSLYENDLVSQVGMFSYIEGTGGTTQSFTTTASNASWAWCGAVLKEGVSADTPAGIFPVGPGPAAFVPGNQFLYSTWNVFAVGVPDTIATDVNAESTSVSVQSFDGDVTVAPNADTATASVAANDANKTVAPNAGTTTASVVSNAPTPTLAVNAGLASVTVASNASTALLQPNAGTTTATVTTTNAVPTVASNAGTTTAVVAVNNAVPTVAPNAETTTVTVTALDASVVVLEDQAGFKNGPSPVFSPLNPQAPSTWKFFSQSTEIVGSSASVDAGVANVTVTANDGTADLKPNAGTTTASVVASNIGPSVAANAGVASVTVTANSGTPSVASNAETTSVTGAASSSTSNVAPGAGTTTAAVVANNVGPSVAVGADIAQVTVAAHDAAASVPEDLNAGPKLGPSPIFSPLNPMAPSTWSFYGQPTEVIATNASAGNTTAAVTANAGGPSVQPNADSVSVSATANQPGANVKVNAGVATAAVTSLQVTITEQPNAGNASVVAVASDGSISVKVNAGIANVSCTAYQPTTPIAGVANAGIALVNVVAFAAVGQGVDGSIHDYSGISGLTIAGEHSGNTRTETTGVSRATSINNSNNTASRVEGG